MKQSCPRCDSKITYIVQSPNFVDYLKCESCGHMGLARTQEEEIRHKVVKGLTRTVEGKSKRFGFK